MQNSRPFPWVCNCTHMVISHGRDRSVESRQWKLNLWHADPAWGSAASSGHALSPVRQQEATWLVSNPFSFLLRPRLVLLAERVLRLGFAV